MRIYFASRNSDTLALWARVIGRLKDVDYIDCADVTAHMDSVVMSGVWAFDRYGGRPDRTRAQIVINERDGNLPGIVIIPPFRPLSEQQGVSSVREDFKSVSPAYYAASKALEAAQEELGSDVVVVFHLPLLGMDDPLDESTPHSVSRAVEAFLSQT